MSPLPVQVMDNKDDAKLRKKLSASKTIQKPGDSSKNRAREAASPTSTVQKATSTTSKPSNVEKGRKSSAPHPTGNSVRDKVRQLLTDALFHESDDIVQSKDAAGEVANDIECAIYSEFSGTTNDYKMKARELKFNFTDPKNIGLRARVLQRDIPPDDLVKLSSQDLANEDLKQEREKLHQHFLREAAAGNKPAATTKEFKCGKCKKRECTYYQMQTRSADEPLTTFVQCVSCGNRWKF